MTKKKFYVTTAIDYVNAKPHIGHAYQKIIADVLARWHKLIGEDVLFVTGTDEHGKKVLESAKKAGKDVKVFVNEISKEFEESWKVLNIKPDRFIRTTDEDHEKVVNEIVKRCEKSGDIYLGEYEGLYCLGCEKYYTEKDLVNGECPFHPGKKLESIKEQTYFFRLSKYQGFLLDLYDKHPEFVLPKARRNEVISRVKEGLRDLSISRTNFNWGIPFVLDKKHVLYVWFEALINYYTATRKKGWEKFWGKPTIHLLGKDNTWFHAVIWPAILKSAGIELPRTTFNHGFLSFNGQKISKSLGNVISPKFLVEKYGADSVRYFVCRQFPFAEGDDGDFDEEALVNRHNNELANKLGNLVSRVSGLIEKNGVEKCEVKLLEKLNLKKIEKFMENYELDKALNEIFSFIDKCNEYVQDKKPWETGDKKVLFELKESILKIAELLSPFIPESAEKISKQFKAKEIRKAEPLFRKIEYEKTNKAKGVEGIMSLGEVNFEDWGKLDLRVAEIKQVEEIDGADKLYKLVLDVGEIGKRVICSGLKEYYSKKELKGKRIIYFSNLKPRKMRGVESHGMLLAAVSKDRKKIVLISPEKDIEVGSRVS
jgi:methionyl-tRNA synthetase